MVRMAHVTVLVAAVLIALVPSVRTTAVMATVNNPIPIVMVALALCQVPTAVEIMSVRAVRVVTTAPMIAIVPELRAVRMVPVH